MAVEGIDRREFILKTALGLITASLGASTVRSASAEIGKSSKNVYRTLGNTKLQIPLVSFGVMNSDSPDLIRKALEMGVKHLDTAHVYLRGNSEKVIGWLALFTVEQKVPKYGDTLICRKPVGAVWRMPIPLL